MAKPIQVFISEPCHENWDKMTPTQQGAFCGSCQKNVFDFSDKTQNEIYELLSNHSTNLCGRFREDQLNVPLVKTEIQKSLFNWKAIAASLATLIAAERISAADTATKPVTKNTSQTAQPPATCSHGLVKGDVKYVPVKTASEADSVVSITLKGKIIDNKTKAALAGAVVMLSDSPSVYAQTDKHGNFTITFKGSPSTMVSFTKAYEYNTLQMPVSELQQLQTQSKTRLLQIALTQQKTNMVLGMWGMAPVEKQSKD